MEGPGLPIRPRPGWEAARRPATGRDAPSAPASDQCMRVEAPFGRTGGPRQSFMPIFSLRRSARREASSQPNPPVATSSDGETPVNDSTLRSTRRRTLVSQSMESTGPRGSCRRSVAGQPVLNRRRLRTMFAAAGHETLCAPVTDCQLVGTDRHVPPAAHGCFGSVSTGP